MKLPAFIVANWKMFKTRAQAREFVEAFRRETAGLAGRVRLGLCPPFTALDAVHGALAGSDIVLGAQDMHWEGEGAFTGAIAPGMLVEAGCTHVIIGHSERRRLFGDSDEVVNKKLKAAVQAGLTPIVCVGETLTERDAGRTEQVIWSQLTYGLEGLAPDLVRKFVVAYEPVWAIGTGRIATPEQAQEVHAFIRAFLRKTGADPVDPVIPILYGGSVKADNIAALLRVADVDGGLVGGASLDPKSFAALARAAAEARGS